VDPQDQNLSLTSSLPGEDSPANLMFSYIKLLPAELLDLIVARLLGVG
jgi:hypothetical protein